MLRQSRRRLPYRHRCPSSILPALLASTGAQEISPECLRQSEPRAQVARAANAELRELPAGVGGPGPGRAAGGPPGIDIYICILLYTIHAHTSLHNVCKFNTHIYLQYMQVARQANAELLELPAGWEGADPGALLAAVSNELHSPQEPTRLAALHWLNTLLARSRKTVRRPFVPLKTPVAAIHEPRYHFTIIFVGMAYSDNLSR